jgi:hypothetical protein
LGHTEKIDDADNEEIPVGFLPDFLAQKRGLQIGENSSGLHKLDLTTNGHK